VRVVLDGISDIENLKFEELCSRLELHFGEGHLAQTYYTQFTNRRQRFFEDWPLLVQILSGCRDWRTPNAQKKFEIR